MKKTTLLLMAFAMFVATAQEFQMVKNIHPNGDSDPEDFTEYNGKLYFSANDGTNGWDLWATDGTSTGTQKLSNEGIYPEEFTEYNGKLYFSADQGAHRRELWVTDGTATGTLMLKNINPNTGGGGWFDSSMPSDFTEYGDKLYFRASDGTNGFEPWVTDGTTAGTIMLKDINTAGEYGPLQGDGDPWGFTEYNGKLYFRAFDSNAYALWVTNGTTTGTLKLKDVRPQSRFTEYNGRLYFSATDGTNGYELWVTDGTEVGTLMLKDIDSEPNVGSDPANFTVYDGKLYFTAKVSIPGYYSTRELWVTDGTTAGTVVVSGGTADSQQGVYGAENLIVYNDHLYFSGASDYDGKELWKSDGTTAGTQVLKNINTANYAGSNPGSFYVYNGRLYFTAIDGSNGRELWESDGTESGTVKIQPAVATSSNPLSSNPYFTELNGSLYFSANFDSNGREVWKLTTENLSTETIAYQNKISLYPNPVQDQLHIQTQEEIKQIKLISFTGQLLQTWNTTTTLDLSNYAQGIYFVQINTENSSTVEKIIKK